MPPHPQHTPMTLDQGALSEAVDAFLSTPSYVDMNRTAVTNAVKAYLTHANTPRPIETARRDGTYVLGYDGGGQFIEVVYVLSDGVVKRDRHNMSSMTTHWLPLPVVGGV